MKIRFVFGFFISLILCQAVYATADTLRVVRSGALVKTASPIVTNLTVEGTVAVAGVTTFSSAYLPKCVTLNANATTANAAIGNVFFTQANSGATAITTINGGTTGQVIRLIGGSATNSTTLADSGSLKLTGAFTLGLYDSITLLCYDGTNWVELSRADN